MASIKFAFKDEIRRVLLREDGGNLTFSKLIETVLTLFPSLTGKSFHLYWQDDESDLITLQSNAELDEAINVMQSFGTTYTLKFLIKLDEESRPAPAVGKDPRGVGVVHQGITCDECNVSPICGIRYKCTVRKDFDLCETCEAKKLQPHAMIKITDPSQAPEILIFGVRDQPPAHPPVGRGNYHHPHNPHHLPHHPAGCGRERHWQRGQRLGGEGENPHPSCGRGRHWGGPRCGRWGEKIAELVKDPVVAPFVAAMDEFISSATASATNNNGDSNPPPQETFNNKPTEVNQLEQEMIEKAILESLVINESKPTAPVEEKPKPALVQEKKPAVVHLDTARPAVPTLPKPALRFVRDNTIPDGTVLQPGAVFRKAWRVRNDGAHPWPEGAVLVSVGGDIMSDQDHKEPLPVLAPEQDGEIAIQLTAPEKAGMYTAYYRAQTKEQQYFGQRLWASIVVADHENDWTVVSEKTPAVSPLPPAPTSLPEPPVIPVAPAVPSAPAITANVATPSVPSASEERKEDEASIVRETTFVETVQVPPPSEAAQPAAHLRSAILLWRRELAILSEMGFSDAETILPLLQQHLGTPLSLSADKNAAPKMEGMQQIVATLLQLN